MLVKLARLENVLNKASTSRIYVSVKMLCEDSLHRDY